MEHKCRCFEKLQGCCFVNVLEREWDSHWPLNRVSFSSTPSHANFQPSEVRRRVESIEGEILLTVFQEFQKVSDPSRSNFSLG